MAVIFSGKIGDPIVRDDILTAFEKISHLLPRELSLDGADLQEIISFTQKSFHAKGLQEQFLEVMRAIEQRFVIEITYDSFSSRKTGKRRIDPYHLRKSRGMWYLIGYCHTRKQCKNVCIAAF